MQLFTLVFTLWVPQEELERLLSEQGQLAITMEAELARTEASCRDLEGDVQVEGARWGCSEGSGGTGAESREPFLNASCLNHLPPISSLGLFPPLIRLAPPSVQPGRDAAHGGGDCEVAGSQGGRGPTD